MKHISIAAKISISITERQQNLNTLANFFSEYIINNNVNFQIDVFCWVLGMPPRQSVTAEETQIIDSVTEQENEQNFEPESAPIILLSQLRINQTASSPPQTHASNLDVEEHPENRDEASTSRLEPSEIITESSIIDTNGESEDPLLQLRQADSRITVDPPQSSDQQIENPHSVAWTLPYLPTFETSRARMRTFLHWPAEMTQTPREMALAGFYYMGYRDITKCFNCGGVLTEWEALDDPWVEHARWFPECTYVRNIRGQHFIDMVQDNIHMGMQRENTPENDTMPPCRKRTKTLDDSATGNSLLSGKRAKLTIIDRKQLPRQIWRQKQYRQIIRIPFTENSSSATQSKINEMQESNTSSAIYNNKATDQSNGAAVTTDKEQKNQYEPITTTCEELTELIEENRNNRRLIRCKVCLDKDVSIVFLPCGHIACCEDCAPKLKNCPICRESVKGTANISLV